jgi:RNA polymerase primary sigma factor
MVKRKAKKTEYGSVNHNSERNSLLIYMQEINKIPLLSKSEEEKVAMLAAQGNKEARERLVNANLRFVITVAKKYQGKGLQLEDLISEGNMGLLNAVDHFDVKKGYRFITYAVWWIRQSIIKAINEKGRMIRLPCNKTNELSKIDKTRKAIQDSPDAKNDPTISEIAMLLDMPEEKVTDLLRIYQDVLYLDDQSSNYYDAPAIKDLIEDEYSSAPVDSAINSALRDELEDVIKGLEEREANVIRSRFGLGTSGPKTLKEIGAAYNLSKERVRQIEKRALLQLRESSKEDRLKSYIA